MKLVSDLKQFLILNDFPSVNEAINQRNQQLRALQEECDKKLIALRDEISVDLYELEEEYYSSSLLETGTSGLASGKSRHLPGRRRRQRNGAESSHPAGLGAFAPAHQRARSRRPRASLKGICPPSIPCISRINVSNR
ncbi:mediator of RNA polymerase II transcription subunit 22 isoform X6 [Ahaetulla prasina]|nr:mediator of RNA polymerase II transcription subunit 22 isoform X6 [Ahaetulla prasina]